MTAGGSEDRARIDVWLWRARFFKTRALAARVASSGKLRINGVRCAKPGRGVRVGDALAFPQGRTVRAIEIVALGDRRGPASEAATLYRDLAAAPTDAPSAALTSVTDADSTRG